MSDDITIQVELENQDVYIDVIQEGGNGGNIDTSAFYLKSNPSGFITGVDLSNFYTNDNPSGFITGVDLSNYNLLYTTGNQIKSGRLIIGNDAISIVDPNSQYTLSLQTNSPATWLEILNNSGANKGVFFGIDTNDFEQYNWQGGDIKFFTSENPSDGTVRLTIKNDGKVGIGTSYPSEKLEVAGNIKVSNTGFFVGVIKTDSIVSIQNNINLGAYYFNSGEGTYRPPFNTGEIVFVNHFSGSSYYNPDLFGSSAQEEIIIVEGIIDTNEEIRMDPYYTGIFPCKWSDLNGIYVKTSVAVTPSITEPSWLSGLGMHNPESGTFNYYFKSDLDTELDGISYFLAPGNKAGWGPDPDEDALTDTAVNYWRLCSLADYPSIFFTNPSTDPYTFPLEGWVPVDPGATPPENQGSEYLSNYDGGFEVSSSTYSPSGSYALYINTFNSNAENNYEGLSVLTGADVIFSLEQNGYRAVYKTNSGSFNYADFGVGIIFHDMTYGYSQPLTLIKGAGVEFTSGDPVYVILGSGNQANNFSITSGNAIFGGNLQSNTATFIDGIKVKNYIEGGGYGELSQNLTDGLLGIQYSGYFDNDPQWFKTAAVKPIINEIILTGSSESEFNGIYTRAGSIEENQGGYNYQGDNGAILTYYSLTPTNESYWYLNLNFSYNPLNSKFISYDLETWGQNPDGPYGSVPPTTTITQTQNFENTTNFGVGRALANGTSWEWVGYFKPKNTANHTFDIYADENAYFWIGNKALDGYTTGNADIFSAAYIQGQITGLSLTSGVNYPVRIQWGHPANPTALGLALSYNDGINGTNNFSGVFFHGLNKNGFYLDGVSGNAYFVGNVQANSATFNVRPTVNGTGVLLSGEATSLPDTIVYTTGNQIINGEKNFNDGIIISSQEGGYAKYTTPFDPGGDAYFRFEAGYGGGPKGLNIHPGSQYISFDNGGPTLQLDGQSMVLQYGDGILLLNAEQSTISNNFSSYKLKSGVNGYIPIDYEVVYNTGNQTISDIKNFTSRPTVNGTGVLLSGDANRVGRIQYIQNSTNVTLNCETYDTFVVQVSEPTAFTYANFQEGQSINIYLVSDHNGHVQHTFPTNTTFAELGDANIIYSFENYTTRILLQKIGEEIINFSSINLTPDGLFNFPAYHTMTVDFTITDIIVDVEDGAYSLYPTFDPAIKNYCAQTPNSINDQISPWSITVNGEKQSSNVNNFLRANDLVKVIDGTNSYFIRFLPSDVSYITPDTPATGNYHEGYYQAAFYGASNYYYIFDKNGVPLWYYTDGTSPLSLHRGNDKNRVVTNPWVNETRGILEIKNKYITGTYYNPVNDSDGNPVDGIYMWDNHEAQELVGPPSRRGNFIAAGYVDDGFYFQEQNAAGELVWDWYSIEAFSNTNAEAYHINSVDVHPINGDIICSVRHTSSIICIDYATKNVKWVLQGDNTPYGSPLQNFAQGSRTANTKWIDGENIIGEPEYNGEQYNGTCTQHDARYHMDILPVYDSSHVVISVFDDQSGGHSYSRGVIYEIDENTGTAYHRFSTFSDDENSPTVAQSPFMGSYTVLKESDNSYSHVITLVQNNISVLEYHGSLIPVNNYNTADKVLTFDTSGFTNAIYRFIKVPLTHFNINNLRNTAGLPLNTEVNGTYENFAVDTV
jgi:hypothetical protein